MPKIVLNEYDKTKAGIGAYANFSVVVPGFSGEAGTNDSSIFDENGIYECSSQDDFVKYVGKQSYKLKTDSAIFEPVAAEPTVRIVLDPDCDFNTGVRTDNVAYKIDEGGIDCQYTVTYKNSSFFTEALNAWYSNRLNYPAGLDILDQAVKHILSQNSAYVEATADEFTIADASDCIYTEVDADHSAYDPENEVAEITLSIKDDQGENGLANQALELGYISAGPNSEILFTAIEGEEFITDENGELTFEIANSIFATDRVYLRCIAGDNSINDRILYPFASTADTDYSPYFLTIYTTEVEAEESYILDPEKSQIYQLYSASINTEGDVGHLKTMTNSFKVAEANVNATAAPLSVRAGVELSDGGIIVAGAALSFDVASSYYIIRDDLTGHDGDTVTEDVLHYGNQIAYELLGMGYTVLYKNLTLVDIDKLMDAVTLEEVNEFLGSGNGYVEIPDPTLQVDAYAEYLVHKREAFMDKYCTAEELADGSIRYNLKYEYSSLGILADGEWWKCLKDKSTYDFRYILTGLLDHNAEANACIMKLAHHDPTATGDNGRGDCVALIDIDRSCYSGTGRNTQTAAIPLIAKEASKYASKYAAVFAPTVTYLMTEVSGYEGNRTFPGSFHYLACAAKAAENYNEWYANAGYTRGVCNYTIESTGCKFGEVAVQALEPRHIESVGKEKKTIVDEITGAAREEDVDINTTVAVNLIVKVKNMYYLWGNRTAHPLGAAGGSDGDLVASHFLNIRQLCSTLKKQVYVACRRFTFDPNSTILWLNFCSAIRPTLEKMKADQGVKDYAILPVKSSKKAVLASKIRLVPIEAVEDFYIDIYLEDSISGPEAEVSESE
jgi:hypothetical protein